MRCSLESAECTGEVKNYQYPQNKSFVFYAPYCEFHKRGELVQKVKPSLPYQSIPRRPVEEKK